MCVCVYACNCAFEWGVCARIIVLEPINPKSTKTSSCLLTFASSPTRPKLGPERPHAQRRCTTSMASAGRVGHCAHHRAARRSSPGIPKQGCVRRHRHFLFFRSIVPAGRPGQILHHSASRASCPGIPKFGRPCPHSHFLLSSHTGHNTQEEGKRFRYPHFTINHAIAYAHAQT
jgi:hypothetical protein